MHKSFASTRGLLSWQESFVGAQSVELWIIWLRRSNFGPNVAGVCFLVRLQCFSKKSSKPSSCFHGTTISKRRAWCTDSCSWLIFSLVRWASSCGNFTGRSHSCLNVECFLMEQWHKHTVEPEKEVRSIPLWTYPKRRFALKGGSVHNFWNLVITYSEICR